MKFEIYAIGNRIAIRTIKKQRPFIKVTYMTFEKAKNVIRKIISNNWTVIFLDNISKSIILGGCL